MSPLAPSPRTLIPNPHWHPRRGFSLIELMVVIAIIGILVAMILPALNNVRGTVRVTEVATEIKGFEQAITEFKLQYGQEPPSGIALYEAPDLGVGLSADPSWFQDTSNPSRLTQSRTLIRSMWPQFDFSVGRNLNGDADSTDAYILTGDECLVFFLGGVNTIAAAGDEKANGFSSNPSDPFASDGNRVGPFTEFDPDRFLDVDTDGAFSYVDPYITTAVPYMYLSSYGGRRYRVAADGDSDGDGTPQLFTSIDNDANGTQDVEGYSVYMQKDPESLTPNDVPAAAEAGEVPWKENSYQIISAGADGIFGCGGIWSNEDGLSHNFATAVDILNLKEARDNITNFSGGTLE